MSSENITEIIQKRLAKTEISEQIIDRFTRYVKIDTQSDDTVPEDKIPSTDKQWDLARLLEKELKEMGVPEVIVTENAYVIGRLPATPGYENIPGVAFNAHMDTALEVSGANVKPQIHRNHDGKPIKINDEITLTLEENPVLKNAGDTIITTDGTTLLGGDDKSGSAEIMTALSVIMKNNHGLVEVMFSPDEEIGRGMDAFKREYLKSEFCYTVDGLAEPEISIENFDALTATVKFIGRSIHPGDGRNRLINPILMAAKFIEMIPQGQMPETTMGREGYYWPMAIQGEPEEATLRVNLRDFEAEGNLKRFETLVQIGKAVESAFPGSKVEVTYKKSYSNMIETIRKDMRSFTALEVAYDKAGVKKTEPLPIRGGTDGTHLAELGIPTPNIFTGGRNCHSRSEFVVVSEMVAAAEVIINVVDYFANQK